MNHDDIWDGEERRGIPRKPITDIATLAVAVGYLRRSIDVLAENVEAKLKHRTRIFRLISIALLVATVINTFLIFYIRHLEIDKAEILAEAVVVSCESRKDLERSIIDSLIEIGSQQDGEPDENYARRLDRLNVLLDGIESPPCISLIENLPMIR